MWIWRCKEKSINFLPYITLVRAKILSISLASYLHAKSPTRSDENRPSTVVARKSDSYLSAIKERGGLPVLNIRCRLSQGWGHFLVQNYTTNSKCMDTIVPFFLRNIQRQSVKFVTLLTIISLSNTFCSKLSISKFVHILPQWTFKHKPFYSVNKSSQRGWIANFGRIKTRSFSGRWVNSTNNARIRTG